MINNWEYGKQFVGEAIDSIDEWSDDKEVGFMVMDKYFDYLWDLYDGKLYFKDAIYALDPGDLDEMALKREANGTLEMCFDTFVDLFKWILANGYTGDYADYMKERIAQ